MMSASGGDETLRTLLDNTGDLLRKPMVGFTSPGHTAFTLRRLVGEDTLRTLRVHCGDCDCKRGGDLYGVKAILVRGIGRYRRRYLWDFTLGMAVKTFVEFYLFFFSLGLKKLQNEKGKWQLIALCEHSIWVQPTNQHVVQNTSTLTWTILGEPAYCLLAPLVGWFAHAVGDNADVYDVHVQ